MPDYLVPKPDDYQRDPAHILRAAGADGPECAICMGPVNAVTGEFMVTPCDHMFHEICLRAVDGPEDGVSRVSRGLAADGPQAMVTRRGWGRGGPAEGPGHLPRPSSAHNQPQDLGFEL